MTIDEAINEIENVLSADLLYDESIDYQLTSDDTEWLEMAITALRAQQEAEKNEPLTIDQLRNMHGYPVWITPSGFWAIVIAKPGERVRLRSGDGETVFADKEIELVGPVYRRPPETK